MYRQRVTSLFMRYSPASLASIDKVLEQYKGSEDELLESLERRFGTRGSHHPLTPDKPLDGTEPAGSIAPPSPVGAPWRVSWPDPDPTPSTADMIQADDVSGLSGGDVSRILQPRCEADVAYALQVARLFKLPVAVRGTQHSMGGQCVPPPRGILLDLKRFNGVSYDAATGYVTCDAGAMWSDLILHLNPYGLSPRTMQSYCSFSIGGTVSVNGHGITTDHCLNESIVSMRMMLWDGRIAECGPSASTEEGRELFRLAVGGYGLFGVILTVTMTVARNVNLEQLSIEMPIHEFPDVFESVQRDPEVDIKLTRVDVTTLETVSLFIFRKTQADATMTVSSLGAEAHRMGAWSRLMYKWLAPTMKELRYAIERNSGVALDWDGAKDRNSLMFESAQPLSRLVSPFLCVDDTFILQEYFVPKNCFTSWIRAVRPILKELDASTVGITLMNITIRFVQHDPHSVLKYATCTNGMYAFVLYLRIQRTPACDVRLGSFQRRLIDETTRLQGTFYLPYRRQYTQPQLLSSYPNVPEFVRRKEFYDPHGMFDNLWFREYGTPHLSEGYPAVLTTDMEEEGRHEPERPKALWDVLPPVVMGDCLAAPGVRLVPNRCPKAFDALLRCPSARQAFRDLFLERVFQVRSAAEVYRTMWLSYYRAGSEPSDDMIYADLYRIFREGQTPLRKGRQALRSLAQIDEQREELTTETLRLLHRLGKAGQIGSYVSIGDHGRLVKRLKEALMPPNAPIWIVHDDDGADSVAAAVERSDSDPVGIFVPIDYRAGAVFPSVPSHCADLVTMNQGLHHIPQEHLPLFLKEVYRVLRPGGLFIVREHDALPHLLPMLELAHSVFNALTGVLPHEEKKEVRAFRPILEWRQVIQSTCGLVDTMTYEMQADDPTMDEMMCFFKPPWGNLTLSGAAALASPPPLVAPNTSPEKDLAAPLIAAFTQIPNLLVSLGASQIDALSDAIRSFERLLVDVSPNAELTRSMIHPTTSSMITMLGRVKPMLAQAQAHTAGASGSSGALTIHHIIPRDLMPAYRAVARRVARGDASAEEAFVISLINVVHKAVMGGTPTEEQPSDAPHAQARGDEAGAAPPPSFREPPTQGALLVQLQRILKRYPRLLSAEYWTEAGVSPSIQSIALSKEPSLERAASWLAGRLDDHSWEELQAALLALERCEPPLALHMDLILNKRGTSSNGAGNSGTNPWHRAVVAILGSTKLQVTQAQRWYASVAGYGELIELVDIAKEVRAAQDEVQSRAATDTSSLDTADQQLHDALMSLSSDVVEVVMTSTLHSITDVAQVLLVEHRGDDVTDIVVQEFLRGRTLALDRVNLDDHLRYTSLSNTRLGQFFGGPMVVRVRYRSVKPPLPTSMAPHVNAIRTHLRRKGLLSTSVSPPSWTFFKLTEWMQVEMAQHFGRSMESAPWYRYPFTDVFGVFVRVLSDECRAVQKRHGFASAFLSQPFLSSAVPAVVMGLLYGQMQLLAAPIKLFLGSSYEGKAALVERVHFVAPEVADRERSFGSGESKGITWPSGLVHLCGGKQPSRIHSVRDSSRERRNTNPLALFRVELPVFQPFTDGIRELSRIAGAQVIDISSQEVVQVKVAMTTVDAERWTRAILEIPTCAETTRYRYPTTVGEHQTFVAFAVSVPYLLHLIRLCEAHQGDLRVVQVFDFWKG